MSPSPRTRWIQLFLGLVCMIVISSPQYVWALLTQPMTAGLGATLPELQVTFSILIVVQTFLSPWQGVLVDRFGPRVLLSIGVVVTGLSWMLAAHASSLMTLYLTYGLLGGIGTGIVYVGVVGHMVQWFPDKRGLATGLAAAGYGIGALLTTFPIAAVLRESTYQDALTRFGLIFAVVGLAAAQGLRRPDAAWQIAWNRRRRASAGAAAGAAMDASPVEMLGTPIFWLMFAMMTMMSTTGLMVTSQMGAFTRDFGMAGVLVFGLPVLPLALSIDRITNGATRPFFGWISDRIGRENTMLIAFALEGTAMTLWLLTRGTPVVFVLLSGLVFFGWGEIFSLFPSTLTDTFGTKHATANYGCLYMAQGIGSILGGPVAALLHESTGSWMPVFAVIITMDFTTAALAIAALKPMRRRWLEKSSRNRLNAIEEERAWTALRTNFSAFGAAFAAGAINSVAGGGTLVSFPVLIWLGLPSITANATSTVAIWPGSLGGMFGFRRELNGAEPRMFSLIGPSLVGGIAGALLLKVTPTATFDRLVPLLILFATGLFMAQDAVQRMLASGTNSQSGWRWLVSALAFQLLVGLYGGYFGAGIGILMLAALGIMGLSDIHQMNGLKNLMALCINGVAAAYFVWMHMVSWPDVIVMAIGAIAGGLGGAGMARRLGRVAVRRIVIGVGLLTAVQLMFRH